MKPAVFIGFCKRDSPPVPVIQFDWRIGEPAMFGKRLLQRSKDFHTLPVDQQHVFRQRDHSMIDQFLADLADLICFDTRTVFDVFQRRAKTLPAVLQQKPQRHRPLALTHLFCGTTRKSSMIGRPIRPVMNGWRLFYFHFLLLFSCFTEGCGPLEKGALTSAGTAEKCRCKHLICLGFSIPKGPCLQVSFLCSAACVCVPLRRVFVCAWHQHMSCNTAGGYCWAGRVACMLHRVWRYWRRAPQAHPASIARFFPVPCPAEEHHPKTTCRLSDVCPSPATGG